MPKKLTGKVALAARLPKGFREKSANLNGVGINYKIGVAGRWSSCYTALPKRAICGCR
jgi:hypothetical protein